MAYRKSALVTGASRGLGLALARSLGSDGWDLIIDARGEADLAGAAADLSLESGAAVKAIAGD
ncbi:MAG TPA: SDR family NAD(P)-dependent oxidoreductase, partial [Acidimicrobiales bacterium]|nr:SDR family NAD(P)-dependent oxidoreductase [Acidimicrobiales bacterium]